VTSPSAFAIFALRAIIAIANATVLSGGVFNFSKTSDKLSPLVNDDMAFAIRDQSDIFFQLAFVLIIYIIFQNDVIQLIILKWYFFKQGLLVYYSFFDTKSIDLLCFITFHLPCFMFLALLHSSNHAVSNCV
jgi:hypothetical protein